MNETIITNWNSAVNTNDVVYVLGDMFWINEKISTEILKQLNGTKILVKGNHDRCKTAEFKEQFERIDEYIEIHDGDNSLILCHYPIPSFRYHLYGTIHLYGHVHTSPEYDITLLAKNLTIKTMEKPCNMYNVGAMLPYMNFTPQTLEHILPNAQKYEEEYISKSEIYNSYNI